MEILTTQLTLLILIALGILGRKTGLFKKESKKELSQLLYYFLLPALFFTRVSELDILSIDVFIITGSLLPIVALMVILFILRLLSIIPRDHYILLNISICFGSNTFFGIPFFTNLYGPEGQTFSILTATILGVFGIVTTTLFFEFSHNKTNILKSIIRLGRSPIILSIGAGILFSLLKITVPFIEKPLSMLSSASGSLSIIILGIFLYDHFNLTSLKNALLYSLFRFFTLPIVTIIIILLFFQSTELSGQFLIIQSGIPAAISIAVFSERYNWKQDIIPQIVITTSLLSFISLTALYFFTQVI